VLPWRCRGPIGARGLSRRARSSGEFGDNWAKVMLSVRSQISGSLAKECEVVDETRPPHRVARISVFPWC
jgi:hypothetical protein